MLALELSKDVNGLNSWQTWEILHIAGYSLSGRELIPPLAILRMGRPAAHAIEDLLIRRLKTWNTRRAYAYGLQKFCLWCERNSVSTLAEVRREDVAEYVESLIPVSTPAEVPSEDVAKYLQSLIPKKPRRLSLTTVKSRLSAIRAVYRCLIEHGIVQSDPTSSVRLPQTKPRQRTFVARSEVKQLLAEIDTDTVVGLRDRAIVGLLFFSFARISAVLSMRVKDVRFAGDRCRVRLFGRAGKSYEVPCKRELGRYLREYISRTGIEKDWEGPLFRVRVPNTERLSNEPLKTSDAYAMIQRHRKSARIRVRVNSRMLRATGLSIFLNNGGSTETAAELADCASTRSLQIYSERRRKRIEEEIEKVRI